MAQPDEVPPTQTPPPPAGSESPPTTNPLPEDEKDPLQKIEELRKMSQADKYKAAFKMLSKDDFNRVHEMPCFRDGFLYGMTGGAVLGALRFLQRGNVMSACNWAVGGTCALALISHEVCLYQRRAQLERINIALRSSFKTNTPNVAPKGRADEFKPSDQSSNQ
ncbi:hypothetical protein H4R33_004709 [Dimargaris cristalligena]|uniref:Cytochrome c oxidase assembly protein COX20, mitochondrial n=1 Tax=Dimargaris cristalligena TaxID=215637 RepID=A0A4P9ZV42_9FUNG|nr:hypothetical protein H4R33_004709 [Dimargaris cristalligena]RKP37454.1 hypothetical protein BJ085DRAFT_39939 [Dimargaris cristalligena]|eukprot:RKP37454.1 hypothetical protein BJ085DRAFT_39939 [Dimargaris cristalligena]